MYAQHVDKRSVSHAFDACTSTLSREHKSVNEYCVTVHMYEGIGFVVLCACVKIRCLYKLCIFDLRCISF